jgi:hypothetical protein
LRSAQGFLHPEFVGRKPVGRTLAAACPRAQMIFPNFDSSSSSDSTRGTCFSL